MTDQCNLFTSDSKVHFILIRIIDESFLECKNLDRRPKIDSCESGSHYRADLKKKTKLEINLQHNTACFLYTFILFKNQNLLLLVGTFTSSHKLTQKSINCDRFVTSRLSLALECRLLTGIV